MEVQRIDRTDRRWVPFIEESGGEAMIPGWREEVVGDYVEVLKSYGKVTPAQVAARLGISECCAVYWLTDLARDGRVRILGVELVEQGGTPCDAETALACQRKAFCPALTSLEPLPQEG